MHRLLGRQADLLRRVRGLRLLFLAAFGSGLGHVARLRRAHGRRLGPHALRKLGRCASHRRLLAGDRARPDRRPARSTASRGAASWSWPTSSASRVFLRPPVCGSAGADRRAGSCRRLRDRLLPARRLRGAAEPRRGRRAAERAGAAPGGRRDDDRARPARRRHPRRRNEPGLGVRDQRGHVPLLGGSHPPHPARICCRSRRPRPRVTGATSRRASS